MHRIALLWDYSISSKIDVITVYIIHSNSHKTSIVQNRVVLQWTKVNGAQTVQIQLVSTTSGVDRIFIGLFSVYQTVVLPSLPGSFHFHLSRGTQ